MALFGSTRDVSALRYINRELMGNIITQQVAYYKYNLGQTRVNMYGENVEGKFYIGPVLLNCLIERNDQLFPTSDLGVDLDYGISVAFLKDDLLNKNYDYNIDTEFYGANLVPEVGDIITDQEKYYEISSIDRQFITMPGTGGTTSVGTPGQIILYVLSAYLTRTSKLNIIKYNM